MPFTGTATPHYSFGQYLGTDKSSWYDNNTQFERADTAIFGVEQKADAATQSANAAQGTADQANSAAVAAGTKVDTVAAQLSNALSWVSGTFTNPNQSIFTTYSLSYKYNKELGLLDIFGSASGTDIPQGTVIANFATIPDFLLPLSNVQIWVAGYAIAYNVNPQPANFIIQPNGNVLYSAANEVKGSTTIRISNMNCTNGWGTSQ